MFKTKNLNILKIVKYKLIIFFTEHLFNTSLPPCSDKVRLTVKSVTSFEDLCLDLFALYFSIC